MRWSLPPLRRAVPLGLLLFTVAASLLSFWSAAGRVERALERTERDDLARRVSRLQGSLEYLLRQGQEEQVESELATLGADPGILRALLIDDRGQVTAATRRASVGRPAAESMPYADTADLPARQERMQQAAASLRGLVSLTRGGQALEAIYPVVLGAKEGEIRPSRIGILFLEADLVRPKAAARREVELRVLGFGFGLAAFAGLLWLYVDLALSRRVARLVAGAERFGSGDLGTRIGMASRDELGRVAAAFDQMAETVGRDQAQLRESEEELRQHVAVLERARSLEEQLRQAQKLEAVGRLAGGVAHDFNNLLTAILGYVELLLPRLREQPELARHAGEIRKAAQRAADLTRQLLTFSRRQVLTLQVLDLGRLVADLSDMLSRLIGEPIELVTDLPLGGHKVKADRSQLDQVVVNLALNARDAMPHGGRLVIGVRDTVVDEAFAARHPTMQLGPAVLLTVSDNGVGMGEETLSHLFEPFFTTKGVGQGTGLGLATVLGIVQLTGGAIEVDSRPGQGACFRVYLPAAEAGAEPAVSRPRTPNTTRGSEIILVVEDEPALRKMAREILEESGYSVLVAADGNQALRLAAEQPIDLLLTDVVMPGMSGRVVAERLTENRPGLRVVFMSGYDPDGPFGGEGLASQNHFLEKPFSPAVLTRTVREALDA